MPAPSCGRPHAALRPLVGEEQPPPTHDELGVPDRPGSGFGPPGDLGRAERLDVERDRGARVTRRQVRDQIRHRCLPALVSPVSDTTLRAPPPPPIERMGTLAATCPGSPVAVRIPPGVAQNEEHRMTDVWHTPLTPLAFLERSADVFPDKTAIVYGDRRHTYAEFAAEATRVAHALRALRGRARRPGRLPAAERAGDARRALRRAAGGRRAGRDQHPAVHRGGPRTSSTTPGRRCWSSTRRCTRRSRPVAAELKTVEEIVTVVDPAAPGDGIGSGVVVRPTCWPAASTTRCPGPSTTRTPRISINYTSGTTGHPKGVDVPPPRRVPELARRDRALRRTRPDSVYLWTLPMFHCNGWCTPWAVTAIGGTHVCLREVRGDAIWRLIPSTASRTSTARRPSSPRSCARRRRSTLDYPLVITHGGRAAEPDHDRADGADGLPDRARLRAHRDLRPVHGQPVAARMGRPRRPTSAPRCRPARASGWSAPTGVRVVDEEMNDVPRRRRRRWARSSCAATTS